MDKNAIDVLEFIIGISIVPLIVLFVIIKDKIAECLRPRISDKEGIVLEEIIRNFESGKKEKVVDLFMGTFVKKDISDGFYIRLQEYLIYELEDKDNAARLADIYKNIKGRNLSGSKERLKENAR
jgi:hypothetical protein